MKKVFFKKAMCFLLILLMTMTSILSVCFASTYENSLDEPADFLKVISFDTTDDKKYVIRLYNKLRDLFDGREILSEEDFLSTDLIALYECINEGLCEMDFVRASYALDFLEVLAYNNGIRFARS